MLFDYYTCSVDTVLTDTDELLRYKYTNFFNPDDIVSFVETDDININYEVTERHMVVHGEKYSRFIDIMSDLMARKDFYCMYVNGYEINHWYSFDEIKAFIWILCDNEDDDIPIDFYFDDLYNKPLHSGKCFTIYC